jgi:phage-related protein
MKKQSMTFHGLVSTMKDNFQLLLAEVGSALMPALKTLITVITKLVQGPLKIIAKVIASIIAPILEMLGKLFMEIFSAFIPLIQSIMEAVGPLIRLLLKILIPIIGEVIHIILKVLGPAIKALIWVLGKLTIAFTYMRKLVDELVNFIKERNKKANEEYARAFNWLRKNFSMLLSQIKEKFIWLKNKIIEIFQEIVKWLFPDYDQMIAVIKEKFSAFFNWINENFGWVFKKVGEWFDYLAEKFSWLTEKIRKALEFLGIGTAKKEEKEVKLKIKPPSISSTMQQGIKNSTANVNMTNNIGINAGGGIGSRRGAKKIMEQAARNVFTIELKKVLVNAGY